MQGLKKLLVLFLCLGLILSTGTIAFAEGDNETFNDGEKANTTIKGQVAPTIINVSVPTVMVFEIDPNNKDTSYISSVSTINNLSTSPIEVSIEIGETNFRQDPESTWKPVDVLPEDKDWDKLGVVDSETYLALGVKVNDKDQWRNLKLEDTLWVKTQNEKSEKVIFGDIDPLTKVDVTLEVHHGNAFLEEKSCLYNIIWSFSLAED